MLLLTKVKQSSNLFKIKKNRFYSFICDFPVRYVNGCPESKTLSLKYQHLQLLIQTSPFYMGSWHNLLKSKHCSHPATRRRSDVVTTCLCTSQWRRRYASNEMLNDVSVERRQDVSVQCLQDILLGFCDDVSRGLNNDVPSVRLLDISNKFQINHQTTSQCYVTKTSQWYLSLTSY